jgi:hypothetical protein
MKYFAVCVFVPLSIVDTEESAIAGQWFSNHIPSATNTRESKKLSALLILQFIYIKVRVEQVRHFST